MFRRLNARILIALLGLVVSREWREHRHENYKRRTSCAGTCTAGIWADLNIPCATLEHGSRKFGPSGSPIEITRAVELYLNHIVAQMEYR